MTLKLKQHRIAARPAVPPAKVRNRNCKRGQQHLVHPTVERSHHPRQQRRRRRHRQRQRQCPRRPGNVAPIIQRPVNQRQRRPAQQLPPERKLVHNAGAVRLRQQPLRPAPQRRPPRRQRQGPAARHRRPRRRQVRNQQPPRHPVHTKMMDRKQKTTRGLPAGIKPHRLQHHPRPWRQPKRSRLRLRRKARRQRCIVQPRNRHPTQPTRRRNRTRRRHLQPPLPPGRRRKPQPQRVMVIDNALQRRRQMLLAQPSRHPQQNRLVEPIDRAAPLHQPAHDRRRRQSPDRDIRRPRPALRRDNPRDPAKPRYRLMLKQSPRRQHQPGPPRTAHQLDRDDAVAPQRKEVVVDADPLKPQNLGKQPAQDLLLRRARSAAARRNLRLRRRQRATVQLAVRRQRQPIQNHQRRRHQVLRQPLQKRPPQHRTIQRSPVRTHHIAHQTTQPSSPTAGLATSLATSLATGLAEVPTTVLARHHNSLQNSRLRKQRRLNLARLDAEPAKLDLPIRTAAKLQNPVSTPPRQIPAAVHPAPGRPIRVRNKPLTGQTRSPQIAPRQPQARNVKLPHHPNRYRLQATIQNVNPRVPDRTDQSAERTHRLALHS